MGCGCNKPTAPMHTGPHEPAQVPDPVAPVNPTAQQGTKKTQQFSLQNQQGKRIGGPYGSKLEAEADRVRKGYTGIVRPT